MDAFDRADPPLPNASQAQDGGRLKAAPNLRTPPKHRDLNMYLRPCESAYERTFTFLGRIQRLLDGRAQGPDSPELTLKKPHR